MNIGTVKWFDHRKKFGFIAPEVGDKDIFVHDNGLDSSIRDSIKEGDEVEYEIGEHDGKDTAIEVRLLQPA